MSYHAIHLEGFFIKVIASIFLPGSIFLLGFELKRRYDTIAVIYKFFI